jgi:hypothetical protein
MSSDAQTLVQLLTGVMLGGLTLYTLSRTPAEPPPASSPAAAPPPSAAQTNGHHRQAEDQPRGGGAGGKDAASPLRAEHEDLPSWASRVEPLLDPVAAEALDEPSWRASSSRVVLENGHHHVHHLDHRHPAPFSAGLAEDAPSWMAAEPSFAHAYDEPEDASPSWMSRDVVATPIKAPQAVKPSAAAQSRVATTANQITSLIAASRAQAVFLYPVVATGFLGEAARGLGNVTSCETRPGTGRVAVGMAEQGVQCGILACVRALAPCALAANAPGALAANAPGRRSR